MMNKAVRFNGGLASRVESLPVKSDCNHWMQPERQFHKCGEIFLKKSATPGNKAVGR